jgi:iron complex transport system ATP-binding protein
MLRVAGLHYRYGRTPVLQGVDLTIAAGEVVCLVGPNGAGKSTLLKCINRVLPPSQGDVTLDARSTASYRRRDLARAIAYVPQQQGTAAALSVADMIGLGRAPHRGYGTGAHDREIVLDVIEQLALQPLALRLFGELSGGERQRVLIARALAQQGRLMLFDEPTNALDLRHQLETMTVVGSIARERGIAALIAIHDLALASRFSDRLVMLSAGRVLADGAWKDVLAPANVQAAYGVSAIVGSAVVDRAVVDSAVVGSAEDSRLPYVIPIRHTDGS